MAQEEGEILRYSPFIVQPSGDAVTGSVTHVLLLCLPPACTLAQLEAVNSGVMLEAEVAHWRICSTPGLTRDSNRVASFPYEHKAQVRALPALRSPPLLFPHVRVIVRSLCGAFVGYGWDCACGSLVALRSSHSSQVGCRPLLLVTGK